MLPVGRGRTATEIGGEPSESVNATDSVRPDGALAISTELGMWPLLALLAQTIGNHDQAMADFEDA